MISYKKIFSIHALTIASILAVAVILPLTVLATDFENQPCGGSLSCGGGDSGPTTEGQACYVYNSCGSYNAGTISGGVCSYLAYTGTNGKGQAQYAYYPLGAPANPANLGVVCSSASNACGVSSSGSIGCSGTCSVTAAPALPTGYGTACTSPANACGSTTSGTIGCNGLCSVTAVPALPTGYGTACTSPANACGVFASGTIGCDSLCSVTSAPSLPSGYGESCQSAANSCGMRNTGVVQCSGSCSASAPPDTVCAPDPTTTLKATPGLVQKGSGTTVVWTSTDSASCTVTGTNGDSWSGTSGSRTSSAIDNRVTYSISCTGLNTHTTGKSIIVDLVPIFQEL